MSIVRWAYLGIVCVAAIRFAAACGDSESGAPSGPIADASIDDASATHPDGDPNLPADPDSATVLPSYCNGIVLYASFDTGVAATIGGGSPLTVGSVRQVASGHFGGGIDLADAGPDGAALYFVRPDGGAPVFPESEGSLAMWVRGNVLTGQPVLYRPVATLPPQPLVTASLTLAALPNRFGLMHQPPAGPVRYIHVFTPAEVRPYLRQDDFNQFVTSWRRGATSGPTAYLTINGGLGKRYVPDAGTSDPYADAGPSDAGNLRVPYRGYSSTKWDSDASVAALRLGAPNDINAPDATIDDLAVWDRVLSSDEITATYNAGISIREACKLP